MSRGQIVTLDLVVAVLIFVLSLGIILAVVIRLPAQQEMPEAELLFMFENLQANLAGTAFPFYSDYRVDVPALEDFAAVGDIDAHFLGAAGRGQGIGLSPEAYDVCMYFSEDGTPILVNGLQAVGSLRDGPCHQRMAAGVQLCDGYRHGTVVSRPVLYDVGSPRQNRIVEMNVVVCKV